MKSVLIMNKQKLSKTSILFPHPEIVTSVSSGPEGPAPIIQVPNIATMEKTAASLTRRSRLF